MKNIKVILIIVIITFLAAFTYQGFTEEEFIPSKLQFEFAKSLIDSIPGVENAVWKTHVDLWIQARVNDPKKAKNIAADVISKGSKELGQIFCVHVHSGDWKELSKLCWIY
ncbi:MAG: hypothetical protein KatS3mg078_0909 [Deltaproteobacteria bacterium]|jgi:hypothetical protein|nr:MAG: hypothetical protein KatS3mg078_0909 [Deltaproteobacteria bacterium]